jgi:hypothetical protein
MSEGIDVFRNTNFFANWGGFMKRNFLLLTVAGAFALALLGHAPIASAVCGPTNAFAPQPPGVTNGGITGGTYAIKIQGAVTDEAACLPASCPDPTPTQIQGLGVITLDNACDVTSGELIYYNGSAWSAPAYINLAGPPLVPIFSGLPTAADSGAYWFNANHQGELVIYDAPSGNLFAFGGAIESGAYTFRGARLNAGDPLIITVQKQATIAAAPTGYAPFFSAQDVSFDGTGGGTTTSSTGVGFDAIESINLEHPDPETGLSIEGGGAIFFNLDNGYDSSIVPGVQIIPGGGAVICDYHGALIQPPSLTDGTQAQDAALNSDWGCPLAPAHFEVVSVLWGTSNQSAWAMTTGDSGTASLGGGSFATVGKMVAAGNGAASPGNINLVTTSLGVSTPVTVTITNNSAEPIDYTGVSVTGAVASEVTIVGGTCLTGGGDINSADTVALALSLGVNNCTVQLQNTGPQCTLLGNAGCTGGSTQSAGSCTALHTPYACCTSAGHGATCGTAAPYACCTGAGTGTCAGTVTGDLLIAGNDHEITPAALQTSSGLSIPVTCK